MELSQGPGPAAAARPEHLLITAMRTSRTNTMKYVAPTSAFVAVIAMTAPAHAHLGHLGDVAGHSHWIGVAAAGAAAAIAIGLSVIGKKKDEADACIGPEADESEAGTADAEAKA
jgi:hypothetical protein